MTIQSAADLIDANDLAIVIFTKGDLFQYDATGKGETGDWVVDRDALHDVNKIIIYFRDEEKGTNRVFIGNYLSALKLPDRNRYKLRFSMLKEIGTTESNWNDFANSGQNPVSYVGDFI